MVADRVIPPTRLDGKILLAPYDPAWPALYDIEATKIRAALGDGALEIWHVGSTSVPGLAAKPILDIVLAVAVSEDEESYIPALETAGYVLNTREPDWHEHRLLRGEDPAVNLHVFSPTCPEIARLLAFRDRLRADASERNLYESAKHDLAARDWAYVQDYADAKSEVVGAIIARALAG